MLVKPTANMLMPAYTNEISKVILIKTIAKILKLNSKTKSADKMNVHASLQASHTKRDIRNKNANIPKRINKTKSAYKINVVASFHTSYMKSDIGKRIANFLNNIKQNRRQMILLEYTCVAPLILLKILIFFHNHHH